MVPMKLVDLENWRIYEALNMTNFIVDFIVISNWRRNKAWKPTDVSLKRSEQTISLRKVKMLSICFFLGDFYAKIKILQKKCDNLKNLKI